MFKRGRFGPSRSWTDRSRPRGLRCLANALRDRHQRLVLIFSGRDRFRAGGQCLQLAERQFVPEAGAQNNGNDRRLLGRVSLERFLKLGGVAIIRSDEISRNEQQNAEPDVRAGRISAWLQGAIGHKAPILLQHPGGATGPPPRPGPQILTSGGPKPEPGSDHRRPCTTARPRGARRRSRHALVRSREHQSTTRGGGSRIAWCFRRSDCPHRPW